MLRTVSAVVLGAMLVGLVIGTQDASSTLSLEEIKTAADAIAVQFQIGKRPALITQNDISTWLSRLPGFGEKTLSALTASAGTAGITSLAQLADVNYKNEKGRAVYPLSDKELIMVAAFYNLKLR